MNEFANFDTVRLRLASPEEIKSWSHGEVTEPETINYRTFKPVKGGLFCERIFGPTRDFHCYCGKYKGVRFKGVVCDKCGVEVTYSRVRRERMGRINLASPVIHAWFFRGVPSKLGLLLGMPPKSLEAVIYFSRFLVTKIDEKKRKEVLASLKKELEEKKKALRKEVEEKIKKKGEKIKKDALGDEERRRWRKEVIALRTGLVSEQKAMEEDYQRMEKRFASLKKLSLLTDTEYTLWGEKIDSFAEVKIGGEAIEAVLTSLDLEVLIKELQAKLKEGKKGQQRKLSQRLKLAESLKKSGVSPTWMVVSILPVIPPDLRPLVQLEGGRFATSDLNDLYRRVLNRNNRLARLMELGAPEVIIRNEKRMLQEAVDSLIDKGRGGRVRPVRGRQELRSLSDMLRGKKGRFRQNLLGKRVDYSGRSVIVVGPNLNLYECGLPKEMALELFKPFVLKEIYARNLAPNLRSAKFVLEERGTKVWDILEEVTKKYPILLNRAPTLHRLGILAFYPQLIEGNAIQLHPCVCSGFGADFDGDAMSVHIPLSKAARKEAEEVMLSSLNLLKPAEGRVVVDPGKDMLLGTYFLTSVDRRIPPAEKIFTNPKEVLLALDFGKVSLRQLIKLRTENKVVETTPGRLLFNRILPEDIPFLNKAVNKRVVKDLLTEVLEKHGRKIAVNLVDAIKTLGFSYATLSGISLGILDIQSAPGREKTIDAADKKAEDIHANFRRGLITKREEKRLTEQVWMEATDDVGDLAWENLEEGGAAKTIIEAGAAKATRDQIKQISGMTGLVADPTGKIVDLPIRSNYVEGLSGFEYFAGARGARKGLVDVALKTADAGYLTRRLVDVAQDVLIRKEDCGTTEGWEIKREEVTLLASFADRLVGRAAAKGIKGIVKKGELINQKQAAEIEKDLKITSVWVRSPLTCKARFGICAKCYGLDLGRNAPVKIGTPVGIIAAQSIGEPGTQLTLWAKHAGGIVREKEVTQGLPRVEELFEARSPKIEAVVSELSGKVEIAKEGGATFVRVKSKGEEVEYLVPEAAKLIVKTGDKVEAGQPLTEGYPPLPLLLKLKGKDAVQRYLLSETQKVYASHGINLADKHIEIIVRQMFSKVKITDAGETGLIPGDLVSYDRLEEENEKVRAQKKKKEAKAKTVLLGITRSSLLTDSFLAAASFQDTTRVLSKAALEGSTDRLRGLKENVIIGRLIPTGERAKLGGKLT